MSRLDDLKTELADCAARADIESYCLWKMYSRQRWYDTGNLDAEEKEFVSKAVEYLELRGKIERNSMKTELVRIKP